MLAAQLAHALSAGARDAEEAFLGAHVLQPRQAVDRVLLSRRGRGHPQPAAADAATPPEAPRAPRPCWPTAPRRWCWAWASRVWAWAWPGTGACPRACSAACAAPTAHCPAQPVAMGPERLRWLAVAANEAGRGHLVRPTMPALPAAAWRPWCNGMAASLGLALPELRRAVDAARNTCWPTWRRPWACRCHGAAGASRCWTRPCRHPNGPTP